MKSLPNASDTCLFSDMVSVTLFYSLEWAIFPLSFLSDFSMKIGHEKNKRRNEQKTSTLSKSLQSGFVPGKNFNTQLGLF
jgi:hypothetical protein